jgi:hypothetical protein
MRHEYENDYYDDYVHEDISLVALITACFITTIVWIGFFGKLVYKTLFLFL